MLLQKNLQENLQQNPQKNLPVLLHPHQSKVWKIKNLLVHRHTQNLQLLSSHQQKQLNQEEWSKTLLKVIMTMKKRPLEILLEIMMMRMKESIEERRRGVLV